MALAVGIPTSGLSGRVAATQVHCPPLSATARTHRKQRSIRPNAYNDQASGTRRFFFFDPSDPQQVHEVVAQPSASSTMVAPAAPQHPSAPADCPVDLVGGNGHFPPVSSGGGQLSLVQQQQQQLAAASAAKDARNAALQQQLVAELDRERQQVAALRQYESLYREWRVKAEQAERDLGGLQRVVAEKDSELAHGYRVLESSAAERSRLRQLYTGAQEQVKSLQAALGEARHAVSVLQVPPPPLQLPAAPSPVAPRNVLGGSSDGDGSGPEEPMALFEELSQLAHSLAVEMDSEVKQLGLARTTPGSGDGGSDAGGASASAAGATPTFSSIGGSVDGVGDGAARH